jgi:hypothetical protein
MLRRLVVLSQVHVQSLDKAQGLNVLAEGKAAASVKNSKTYATPWFLALPNQLSSGGGPTGMLSAIHCTQNVLARVEKCGFYEKS